MALPESIPVRPEQGLLTSAEVAELLGLSSSTVAGWRSGEDERGPAYIKIGAYVYYSAEDINRWLAEQAEGA